jgi:hypothetical protein
MVSNTPRTDEFEKTLKSWCGDEAECLEFARQLEMEVAQASAYIQELEAKMNHAGVL